MATAWLFNDQGDAPSAFSTVREPFTDQAHLRVRERANCIEVHYAPASVSPVALTSFYMWLYHRDEKPIALMPNSGDRPIEIIRNRRQALRQISDLIARAEAAEPFVLKPVLLERSRFAASSRVAAEVLRADLGHAADDRILNELFDGSYTLNVFDPETGCCHPYCLGGKTVDLDPGFTAKGRSRTYRDMTDKMFGAWVAETFENYREVDAPFAVSIRADVTVPRLEGIYWYERLMLPFERQGRRHMLSAAAFDYAPNARLSREPFSPQR